jgi:hypothetical protein
MQDGGFDGGSRSTVSPIGDGENVPQLPRYQAGNGINTREQQADFR